jgi:hypothetical protein
VALSFACKQIVPTAIQVSYGRGVDAGMLVDWHGGDTWIHVLADAIKPLGLHMVATGTKLEIKS